MENSKKAFVFDLDGTLLNSNKEIFSQNIDAINNAIAHGHYVGIITGRNFSQIQPYIKALDKVQFFVVLNGAAIYDNFKAELTFLSSPLNQEIVDEFIAIAKDIKREIQFSDYERLYRVYFGQDIRKDIVEEGFFKDATKNPLYDQWDEVKHIVKGPILRIAIRCERKYRMDIFKHLYEKYAQKGLCEITESSNAYVECDHIDVSKFNALKLIVKEHWNNLSLDAIYGFGDTENDLSVLSNLTNSVAMGNANDHIKSVCKYTIDNNNTLAIADFINKIIS